MEANQNQKFQETNSAVKPQSAGRSTSQDSSMKDCIEICYDCSTSCLQLIPYCLKQGEKHAEASHILLLQNCAEICRASANFMISNSPFSAALCKLCEDICIQCADDCENFDDEKMKQCAVMCRKCADSCQSMSKMS